MLSFVPQLWTTYYMDPIPKPSEKEMFWLALWVKQSSSQMQQTAVSKPLPAMDRGKDLFVVMSNLSSDQTSQLVTLRSRTQYSWNSLWALSSLASKLPWPQRPLKQPKTMHDAHQSTPIPLMWKLCALSTKMLEGSQEGSRRNGERTPGLKGSGPGKLLRLSASTLGFHHSCQTDWQCWASLSTVSPFVCISNKLIDIHICKNE